MIATINPLALLHNLTEQELHLATETEQDQSRHPLLQYNVFTVFIERGSENRLIYTFLTLSGNNTLTPPPLLAFQTSRDVWGGSKS